MTGLSCLKGNFHEQFLGGLVGAIPPGYPADEETGRKALRLVLTQLPRSRFQPHLRRGVDMTSNVKGGSQIFLGLHDVFVLGTSAEAEPGRDDG